MRDNKNKMLDVSIVDISGGALRFRELEEGIIDVDLLDPRGVSFGSYTFDKRHLIKQLRELLNQLEQQR